MNRFITLSIFILMFSDMNAQNIKDYFRTSPSKMFLPVDSVERIRMCDSDENAYRAVTLFGDSIHLNDFTDNYIAFSYSNVLVQIKLIDDIIVVAHTFGKVSKNSEVSFYNTDWHLKSSWLYGTKCSKMMPSDKKIFESIVVRPEVMSGEEFEKVKLYFDPMLVTAKLTKESDTITLTAECPLLSEEENTKIKTVIKQKTFKWTNGRFK